MRTDNLKFDMVNLGRYLKLKKLLDVFVFIDKSHRPFEIVMLSSSSWKVFSSAVRSVEAYRTSGRLPKTFVHKITESMHLTIRRYANENIVATLRSYKKQNCIKLGNNAWEILVKICTKDTIKNENGEATLVEDMNKMKI